MFSSYDKQRKEMLEQQLRFRGVQDEPLLAAFQHVPRHELVPKNQIVHAYEDRPLDIGYGVTISQPYVVAKTILAARIKPGMQVLEVGTGSGYQTALLSELGADVYTIELIPELSTKTQNKLKMLGYKNIHFYIGDGHRGWPEEKKFDAILLTAAPRLIPEKLLKQLKIGGLLIGPEGPEGDQQLLRITRLSDNEFPRERLLSVRFVPMIETSTGES
jgi:protein-L-isoaspartate(D-aspartate) O-methyltransferase